MVYIDIDNTLTDFDGYLTTVNPRAMEDGHLLFKAIYQGYKQAYLASVPLVDYDKVRALGEFTLLTSLPDKKKLDSFCDDNGEIEVVMSTLRKNKVQWITETFGPDCKYFIVNGSDDKQKFCKSSDDILIDDKDSTCKHWVEHGGKAYTSFDNYLSGIPVGTRVKKTKVESIKKETKEPEVKVVSADLWW